jgi:O-antigen ligase
MKELFLIRDNLSNKISYYHLIFFLASLPFDRFYSHIILISFALHTLIQFNVKHIKAVFEWKTVALQSVFLITVGSTIYTVNTAGAYQEWGKQIAIFLIPLLFCLNPFPLKKYRSSLLLIFSLVCTATVLYLYMDVLVTVRHYQLPYAAVFSRAFTNHNFSEPIGMHATFFSMQLAIALVFLLSGLIRSYSKYARTGYIICALILLCGLLQLCSKSVFIALLLTVNLAVPFFLLNGTKRFRFVLISVSLSILVATFIFSVKTFRERFIGDLHDDLSLSAADETNDPRLGRWNAAAGLVVKAPVIGHGAGSEIGLLQDVFFEKKYYNAYLHRLNAHSQYLSLLIKAGITGLLIYLATLFFGFRSAFLRADLLFFTFMVLVATVCISENLLDVDKGIIFYAFFFSFFVFSSKEEPGISSY